jgi:hypothetical protein
MECEISELIGKTLWKIEGAKKKSNEIIFKAKGGQKFRMYHEQDCCEDVSVDDVCGDIKDLLKSPIVMAEKVTNSDEKRSHDSDDSFTWTFYKLATIKGYVTIRWYGSSNGYYSESVDFCKLTSSRKKHAI